MTLIMDGLIIAAAVFAGTYCLVLARRLRALRDLDSGLGAAITGMTRALEDARRVLEEAKAASHQGHHELQSLLARAETASAQLRILLAATRDLPLRSDTATARAERPAATAGPATPSAAAPERGSMTSGMPERGSRPITVAGEEPTDPAPSREVAAAPGQGRRVEPPVRRPAPAASVPAAGQAGAKHEEEEILAALADFARARRI